jgi:HEAT repeat protein
VTAYNEPFEVLVANLLDEDAPLLAALIYRLSEPTPEDLQLLKESWPAVQVERRRLLVSRMAEASEADFELDFKEAAAIGLQDADAQVRERAIEALWVNEQPEVMYQLIDLLQNDSEPDVRAAAASALGQFVLLGELGELSPEQTGEVQDSLLRYGLSDISDVKVYRRALESIASSSHPRIVDLIAHTFEQQDLDLRAGAVFAMGRNGDRRWAKRVMSLLNDSEPQIRFEAVRATGELGLVEAVPKLIAFIKSTTDREIQDIAIWALGEIGGADARHALHKLADDLTDPVLVESVEDAINMATLSLGEFGLVVMASEEDGDDLDSLDDLDDLVDDDLSDNPEF